MKNWIQFCCDKDDVIVEGDVDFGCPDDCTGVPLDVHRDEKEYQQRLDFLAGRNKPDKVKMPKGWFVVDEEKEQFWFGNQWSKDWSHFHDSLFHSEDVAKKLAEVAGGDAFEIIGEADWLRQLGVGATTLSPEKMMGAKHPYVNLKDPNAVKQRIEFLRSVGRNQEADQLQQMFTGVPQSAPEAQPQTTQQSPEAIRRRIEILRSVGRDEEADQLLHHVIALFLQLNTNSVGITVR